MSKNKMSNTRKMDVCKAMSVLTGLEVVVFDGKLAKKLYQCVEASPVMTPQEFLEKLVLAAHVFIKTSEGEDIFSFLRDGATDDEDDELDDGEDDAPPAENTGKEVKLEPALPCTLPEFDSDSDLLLHVLIHAVSIKRKSAFHPQFGQLFELRHLYNGYLEFHNSSQAWEDMTAPLQKRFGREFASLVAKYGETSNPLIRIKSLGYKADGDRITKYLVELK